MKTSGSSPKRGKPIKWRLVSRQRGDRYMLDALELSPNAEAADIVRELGLFSARKSSPLGTLLDCFVFFRKREVGIAHVSLVSCGGSSAELYPREVIVSRTEADHVLDQAFRHPHLLEDSSSFLQAYEMFESCYGSQAEPERACCLFSSRLHRSCLAVAVLLVVLLCTAAGLVAGLVSHRMNVGFLFAGGAMTFLTAVESVIFWMFG